VERSETPRLINKLTCLGRNATGAALSARERVVRHQGYQRLLTMYMTNAMMANTTKMTIKISYGRTKSTYIAAGLLGLHGERLCAPLDHDLACDGAAQRHRTDRQRNGFVLRLDFSWSGHRFGAASRSAAGAEGILRTSRRGPSCEAARRDRA
jgi:hypothetical protein